MIYHQPLLYPKSISSLEATLQMFPNCSITQKRQASPSWSKSPLLPPHFIWHASFKCIQLVFIAHIIESSVKSWHKTHAMDQRTVLELFLQIAQVSK